MAVTRRKLSANRFIAIDEDAFGDGQTGSTTYPLDTWLENRLDANIRYLRQKLHRATYTFPHDFSDSFFNINNSRRYTAIGDRAAVYMFVVPVDRSTQYVWVRPSTKIDGFGSAGELEMRLWHVGGNLGRPQLYEASTASSTPVSDVFGVTVDVDRPQMALMVIKIKDVTDFNVSATSQGEVPKMANVGYDVSSLSTLSKAQLEVQTYGFYAGKDTNSRKRMNTLHLSRYHPRDGELTSGDRVMSVYPDLDPAGDSTLIDPKFKLLSQSWPESFVIEVDTDARKPGRGFTPKSHGSMRANRPVMGNDVIAHQRNLQAIYESPRVHSYGPRGVPSPDNSWTSQKPRWTKVYGDQSPRTIDDQLIFPVAATGTTKITWYGLVCCAHLIRNQEDIWVDPEVWLDHLGEASWDLRMDVYNKQTGNFDWSEDIIETEVSTQVLPMWAADHQMQIPILNQLWWSYFDDGAGGSRWSKTAMEGVIFNEDWKGPAGQAPIVAISHSIEFEQPEKYNPLRVRMQAQRTGDVVYSVGEEVDQRSSRVVLACVSSTLVEEPVFG